ncbi:MAG TPA: hypothetical protein DDZ89_06290 [Clostridiales bacterium]|nr:hypothetical protein [Clostridiales bacterium]
MEKKAVRKVQTDEDVKRKAVKLVLVHLKKKIESPFQGKESVVEWMDKMDLLLSEEDFVTAEYHQMRKEFNDIIERTLDYEIRSRLRDSWFSLGKALDKKVKRH